MPQGNWFGPQENISTGWTPYHYTAPDIGALVGDILKNRQFEQLNLQNQMSGLGKAIQAQQQNAAYGEAASNAGLLPGVDTTGMSAAQISDLAQRIQQQGTEAANNAYKQALGTWISQDKPLAGGRGGGGRSGGNTVDIYDDDGNYVTSAPAGSVLARQYLAKKYPSLNPGMTPTQAAGQAKALGIPEADFFDSSRHYGYQTVDGGVDQQGNAVPLPLSPDQDPSEATHVGIKPSSSTNPNQPPIIIPRSVFTGIRQGLGAQDNVTPSPGVRQGDVDQAQQALDPGSSAPPPAGTPVPYNQSIPTSTPSGRVMPNASQNAPVNLPQVGDMRPGPNGTMVQWDGHGWALVQQ